MNTSLSRKYTDKKRHWINWINVRVAILLGFRKSASPEAHFPRTPSFSDSRCVESPRVAQNPRLEKKSRGEHPAAPRLRNGLVGRGWMGRLMSRPTSVASARREATHLV